MTILVELPYPENGGSFFAPLAGMPWAMWLDSGHPLANGGRVDILVAFPRATLVARGDTTSIWENGQTRIVVGDPLRILGDLLDAGRVFGNAGGAVGYCSYDLGSGDAASEQSGRVREDMPDMAVGIYDGFVRIDHVRRLCHVEAQDTERGRQWARKIESALVSGGDAAETSFAVTGPICSDQDFATYGGHFAQVQDYIRAGDCYQINLAMRFTAPCSGHPWPLYQSLRQRNPAPYGAWLNFPFGQVLSSSPEGFLRLEAGRVTTRPIKGTRPRADNPEEDARLAAELAASHKDRAENLMIVDLLRNDLGKVCIPGSIHVSELFKVESFATVHHLVSTVTGQLAPGQRAVDLLAAAFPGGSITGAPKRRAMEIIASLESQRRGVYCGAIGYMGFDGDMDLNIAIRTLVCSQGQVRYWAGGGLVADSDLGAEYQECLDKGRAMQEVLEGFMETGQSQVQIP